MNIVLLLISILTFVLGISCLLLEIYIFKKAPFLEVNCSNKPINTSLTVIIPAYNEEINIIKCLNSLNKISRPSIQFKILVVDDSSDDKTLLQVENFKNQVFKNPEELVIISSGPRPTDKKWVGKNWPCYVGSKEINSEWILFIDADVVVGEDCIRKALSKASKDNIDLLSLAPKVNCNCFAEWMVQPIMTSLLMIGFPISDTNDKSSDIAFAAGPFMLFKNDAYKSIKGHEGTHNEVVEDLALAKKIKDSNLKLNFLLAINDISLNMYKDINTLIEGWSKNWFLGLEKSLLKSISASVFVFLTYSMPWLLFGISIIISLKNQTKSFFPVIFMSFLAIFSYVFKRYLLKAQYNIPAKYWFLSGLGGIIVVYISILSILKTYTGKGWTWKGRNLSKT